jgi:hypothetical protein
MLISLVVIDDLDIEYFAILELDPFFYMKWNTPSVAYPDAQLPLAISSQGFRAITRWRTKKIQRSCGVQLRQFAFGNCLDRTEAPRIAPSNSAFGILAGKRLDHNIQNIARDVICLQ